jgi:hypothetical protein
MASMALRWQAKYRKHRKSPIRFGKLVSKLSLKFKF